MRNGLTVRLGYGLVFLGGPGERMLLYIFTYLHILSHRDRECPLMSEHTILVLLLKISLN